MSLKDAIREAADARNKQDQENTESQQDALQQSREDVKTSSSKAVNTANSKDASTASIKAVKKSLAKTPVISKVQAKPVVAEEIVEAPQVETAALTIRVPLDSRIHWLVSAKKQKTTLTAAITEALNERFGNAPIED